jgi:GWxTD domain-containing protein
MPASTSISGKARAAAGAALLLLALSFSCSAAGRRIERDPFFASFYEKTRLIMTGEEIQIYKHLADREAREEFIEEFWQKRDPLPDTPENEARVEFDRRIAYANRWFKENRAAGRGWDTPRGRILIQLGEPDNRYLNEMMNDPGIKGYERWIYYNYQLELIFVDSGGFGEFKLRNWPATLLTAIDHAKFALNPDAGGSPGLVLAFQAGYRDGRITIAVPLKKIRFNEKEGAIRADFRVTVFAYRDYSKIGTQVFDQRLQYPKESLPVGKVIEFSLPYPLEARGKYFLDIILEDVLTGSRSRDFTSFKR